MSSVWKGVSFPWGPSLRSFIEPKDDQEVLQTSVLMILLTRLGERVMRPTFGSLLPSALHEQNDSVLVALLQDSVQDAIARWDDRIRFLDFTASRDGNDLILKIAWQNAKDPTVVEPQQTLLKVGPTQVTLL